MLGWREVVLGGSGRSVVAPTSSWRTVHSYGPVGEAKQSENTTFLGSLGTLLR